jgi:hypothetical protein
MVGNREHNTCQSVLVYSPTCERTNIGIRNRSPVYVDCIPATEQCNGLQQRNFTTPTSLGSRSPDTHRHKPKLHIHIYQHKRHALCCCNQ